MTHRSTDGFQRFPRLSEAAPALGDRSGCAVGQRRARPAACSAAAIIATIASCLGASAAHGRGAEPCNTACSGDLNFDGVVDGADMGLVLGDWGIEGDSCADLDADGNVDGTDLSLMFGDWGSCPAATCSVRDEQWLPGFGPPGANDLLRTLSVLDDGSGPALYAGGYFTHISGLLAPYVARWDGVQWSKLGGGMDGSVESFAAYDDGRGGGPMLYAGGWFTIAGGVPANAIARWDGAAWSALGDGLNGQASALTVFDDGSGPALYAGGPFTMAGGAPADFIARWDGSSWSAVGSGMNGHVHALAVFDDGGGPALYAGGSFTSAGGMPANRIARWNGVSWSPVGEGMLGEFGPAVHALTIFDEGVGDGPALYAGGSFTTAGTADAHGIARWDGAAWSALGDGVDGFVDALAAFDDGRGGGPKLYVAGHFTEAGGVAANNIARWDGSPDGSGGSGGSWSDVAGGVSGSGMLDVFDLAVLEHDGVSSLYVGGSFHKAGDLAAKNVARWDGDRWWVMGDGAANTVQVLSVIDEGGAPVLYAGGLFLGAGGVSANHIARWDGASWSSIGGGVDDGLTVYAITMFDDGGGPALYVGGTFDAAGGVEAQNIARWDGASWSALGDGTNASVQALAVFDDGSGAGPALYAAGSFTAAGGAPANRIARWDGRSWSPLGSGTNTVIHALAVFDDGDGPVLVAGGEFFVAGGVAAIGVAQWNGSSWAKLGAGASGKVNALVSSHDGDGPALYVAGKFNLAGGAIVNHIARWDGEAWSALGAGVSGEVMALAAASGRDGRAPALFATGFFTTAGGAPADRIARWDGSSWSPLGTGLTAFGAALAIVDDAEGVGASLFVGGYFSAAGEVPSARVARWGCPSR